jgi:hypothetical protein
MTITESRIQLETALTDGGIRIVPRGAASPPSAFIVPGTPNWTEPSVLGGRKRLVNWGIMCVVSVASEVSITDQESFAESVDAACRTLVAPWGVLTVNTPGRLVLGGLDYIAFRAEIRTVIGD